MGRIGTLTAYKAIHGLGMKAIGYDPYAGDSPNSEIQRCHNIEEVFRAADFLSLHLPYTPETRHLVDARKLAWMKPSAFVVSVSRGGVVDETALIQALREGRISGAALDVFEQEPPDAENPLLWMGQVIVTPHSAALTRESTDRMSLHAAMSIHEVLAGETPAWAVNRPLLPRGASDSEL
jgi:D-3-phosphoglycerate dehydrogenase